MSGVASLDGLGRQTQVVEAGLGRDLDALLSSFAEHGDGFDGGEMHDVQGQFRREGREGDDFGDGVGFEGWRARIEERLVRVQRPCWGEGWKRALYIVTHGRGDGWDHFGVEHACCWFVGKLDKDFADLFRGDSWEFFDLRQSF